MVELCISLLVSVAFAILTHHAHCAAKVFKLRIPPFFKKDYF